MYLTCTIIVLLKKYMVLESQIRQQLSVTKIKRQIFFGQRPFDSRLYLDISRSFKWKESFIFRYFKVFQLSQMFTCGLSDLLLLAVDSVIFFHEKRGDPIPEYLWIFQGLSSEENLLYLDIARSFKCPKSSPVVCLICHYLRSVR